MNTTITAGYYLVKNTKFPNHKQFCIQVKNIDEFGMCYKIIGEFGFWEINQIPWFWELTKIEETDQRINRFS